MSPASKSKPDTRNAILDAAQHYTQTASYDGFSFRDIAQAVGIRKASVYHHFESKEALAIAMLERARDWVRHWAQTQSERAPAERLRAYWLDMYREFLGAGTKMCPSGAFVSDWPNITDAMRQAVRGVLNEQIAFLSAAMADGYADGSVRPLPGRDEREAAVWFLTTVQGALIYARSHEDQADMFTRLCETTMALIEVGD